MKLKNKREGAGVKQGLNWLLNPYNDFVIKKMGTNTKDNAF
jgi:hypothetical protein